MGAESPNVILYDVNGQEMSVSNGAAIPAGTSALMIAGSDGANSRFITLDTSGRPIVVGAGTAGTPTGGVLTIQGVTGGTTVPVSVVTSSTNPVIIAGSNNLTTNTAFADINGILSVQDTNDRYLLEQVIINQSNYGDLFLDILSYIRNTIVTSVRINNTNYLAYGTQNQSIACTINSLASTAQRQSNAISNSLTLYQDVFVQVKVKTGASGTSATGIVNVYAYGSLDNGVTFGDTCTGTDGVVTLTAPPNLKLIGTINTVANATSYTSTLMPVSIAFNGILPQIWGIVVENKSGAALAASGNSASYQGIQQGSF